MSADDWEAWQETAYLFRSPMRTRAGSSTPLTPWTGTTESGPNSPSEHRLFSPQAWEDYLHWQTADRAVLKRINKLIADACRSPQVGIGKPGAAEVRARGRLVSADDRGAPTRLPRGRR